MNVLTQYRYIILALGTVIALPLALDSGTLAAEILIFSMAAAGCNLLLGYTGLLSIGQGVFLGVGSYTSGLILMHMGVSLPVALVAATLLGAAVALLVGWFCIRQKGTYFVMLTLAFCQLFYFLAYTFSDLTGGDNGLLNIPKPDFSVFGVTLLPTGTPWQYYTMVAVIFVIVFLVLQKVVDSVFGRTLLAIKDNEARASAIGYNVSRFKLAVFVISGAVTGLAGGLHAVMIGIAPLANIDYHASEMILIMAVIGGTGNLYGSVLGAGFYLLAGHWLSALWPRWLMLLGFLLVAVSLYMNKGLLGLFTKLYHKLVSAKAPTEGAAVSGQEERA